MGPNPHDFASTLFWLLAAALQLLLSVTLWGLGDSACLGPEQEGLAFNGWMATRESENEQSPA